MKLSTTLLLLLFVGALGVFVTQYETTQPTTKERVEALKKPFAFNVTGADTLLLSGQNLELRVTKQNRVWRVVSPYEDRAHPELVNAVLKALGDMEWLETMKRDDWKGADWKRTGLNDASLELTALAGRKELARCKIGGPGSIEGSVYISTLSAKSGQLIHLAKSELGGLPKKTAQDWRDNKLLRVTAANVQRYSLSAGNGILEFTRAQDQPWQLTKPLQTRANDKFVNAVLATLLNLDAKPSTQPVVPPTAASSAAPVMKVTIQTAGAETPLDLIFQPASALDADPLASVSDRPGQFVVPAKVSSLWQLQPNHLRDTKLIHVDENAVTGLRIRSIALPEVVMNREGEIWMLTRRGQTELAHAERIHRLFEGLNAAVIREFTADAPATLEPYGLDQPFLEIEWTESGKPRVLQFGQSTEKAVFAKNKDEPFVYQVSPLMLGAIPPDSLKWRGPGVLNLSTFAIKRIIISEGATAPMTLHYDASFAKWLGEIAGKEVSDQIDRHKADALLEKLANLQAEDWSSDGSSAYQALANPTLTVQILLQDPTNPDAEMKPLNIAFAPTIQGKETAVYYGRVNQDADTFLISRDLYKLLTTTVLKTAQ